MELTDLSLSEAREKLRAREIKSVELTEAYLQRIAQVNPKIDAYLTLTAEQALEQAHAADVRIQQGEDTPLLGIPMGIKDVLCTEGVPTTAGSKILEGFKPPYTATSVMKLSYGHPH